MKRTLVGLSLLCLGAATLLPSCSSSNKNRGTSDKTGWDYNDSRLGGFDVPYYPGQQTGPGLAFVEGGRFTMGMVDEDLTMERNNIPRTVSVSSFYMDETEVANVHYREYIYWLSRAYGSDYPELIQKALPDSTVWRKNLAYNEPLVTMYFRHAGYNFYPVVGVNWDQANAYARWRSDRVNEYILVKNGALKRNPNQINEDIYTNETYTSGQYEGLGGGGRKRDLDPNGSGRRNFSYSDGVLLPNYRLPTEAEWEYAALANVGNNPEPETKRRRGEEVITSRNTYPWGTPNNGVRYQQRNSYQGQFLGNAMRGKGDAMGIAGGLNDNAFYPAPIYQYEPNAYGLYNMAGNVSEWVLDTYRPVTRDQEGLNPFRGNVLETYVRNAEDNELAEKDSLGQLPRRNLTAGELDANGRFDIRNYDQRDINDGDTIAGYSYDPSTSLITNEAKVVKGGSWADRVYWMNPGARRFMQQGQSASTVGFRCVMDRIGSPDGRNSEQAGNNFRKAPAAGNRRR